jgi:hypothetical protein
MLFMAAGVLTSTTMAIIQTGYVAGVITDLLGNMGLQILWSLSDNVGLQCLAYTNE